MPFAEGETVGPYRITDRLGQGGMATVFRAYHPNLDRYVAIKVLHPSFKEDSSFLARFQREAQIVAKLEHPNIVPIYDYSEHNGEPYLVMKFIEGETLKARLTRQPLTLEEALSTMTAVGQALTYAHERGVLHRDVKPSNILIEKNGTPYLADFGLARMASAGESTLSQDMMLGTPQYISPEQAQGVQDLDGTTDIYSLGVVLYELVVGRVPFNADTPYAIVHDHIYSPLPLPTKVNPQVPPAVERVLLKTLAKDRADRYSTASDMVEAFRQAVRESDLKELFAGKYRVPVDGLSDILDNPSGGSSAKPGIPSPLPPTNAGTATTPMPQRRTASWLIVAVVLIVVLCIGAFLAFAARNVATKILPTVVQLRNETESANLTAVAAFLATDSATSTATLKPSVIATEAATPEATDTPLASQAVTDTAVPTASGNTASVRPFPPLSSFEAQRQVTAHPDDPRTHFMLAVAIMHERKPLQQPRMWQELQLGMGMTATNPTLALEIARQLAMTPDIGALAAFEYAVAYQAAGDNHPVRNESGYYLFRFAQNASKLEKPVLDHWNEFVLSTQSAGLYAFAALEAHALGQDDQAGKALAKAASLNPDLAEVHLIHGILYAGQNDAASAQKEFDAATKAPDAPVWLVNAAKYLAQKG